MQNFARSCEIKVVIRGKLVTWHSGYTPEPSDDEGYAMDLSVDASSDAMTSAVGGEAKKTLVSPSTRDRKNSSVSSRWRSYRFKELLYILAGIFPSS